MDECLFVRRLKLYPNKLMDFVIIFRLMALNHHSPSLLVRFFFFFFLSIRTLSLCPIPSCPDFDGERVNILLYSIRLNAKFKSAFVKNSSRFKKSELFSEFGFHLKNGILFRLFASVMILWIDHRTEWETLTTKTKMKFNDFPFRVPNSNVSLTNFVC